MKKIAYSLLAGIALGTIVGILVAPAEGKRTQRKLLRKGKNISDDLKDNFSDLVDSFQDHVDTASDRISKARRKFDEYTEEGAEYAGKIKDKYASLKNDVRKYS